MEDYYTIQTPGHHTAMFAELHVLQKQGVMCDVILAAEDGEVMAHKVVLMAASKYFRDKLSPVIGPTASKICLKGISVVELANLVKYIYTGKLLVAKETMDITLEISEILELHGVIQGYKEIISYEQLKDTPSNALSFKSTVSPSQTPVSSASHTSPGQNASPQQTDAQTSKSVDPVSKITDESSATAVSKVSCSSGTQSKEIALISSSVTQPDSNKGSNEQVSEQGAASQAYNTINTGTTSDVNTTQTSSNDFNFDTLYDQQYMEVPAGSQTPSKTPGMSTPQSRLTPSKLQQITSVASESQKIAEERAQHQDLLAVAIETLSDVPHLKQQSHQIQPEVDHAVNTISGTDAVQSMPQSVPHNMIGMKPEDENLDDFENGITSTKTVTMSAGSVSNDLGGKTDVYTVALDPSSIKSPLKMPRPKRSKSAKEKEAEEKAKKYRQIKAGLMSGTATDTKPFILTHDNEPRRGSRQKNSTIKQDFQYESLSKTKKKTLTQKIPMNSTDNSKSETELDNRPKRNSSIIPKTAEVGNQEKIKVPKEEKIEAEGDNFGQVVNFDSESEDDVDGMIVTDMTPAFASDDTNDKKKKSSEKNDGVGTDLKESQKKKSITSSLCITRKEERNKDKFDAKNISATDALKDVDKQLGNVPVETKSAEKQNTAEITYEDDSEMKDDDLQAQNIDETAAEIMRSSSTKRKTRTPRKLPLSDEEKGNESGTDRHDSIPVVRTRRSSRSLNLEKERENKSLETDLNLGGDENRVNEMGKKKNQCREGIGGNIDCKNKDLSKAAEIRIIAQNKIDAKALGEAEMQIKDSKSKKIIIVPKYYQPEVRLKKQSSEEMLRLAKELKGQPAVSQEEIEYETGEENEDDDYEEMSADDFNEEKVNENVGKAGKRKINKLDESSPNKKRKTDVISIAELCKFGKDKFGNSQNKGMVDSVKDKRKNNKNASIEENVNKSSVTREEEMEMKIEVDEEVDEIDIESDAVVGRSNHIWRGKMIRKNVFSSSKKAVGSKNIDKDKEFNVEEADGEVTDNIVYSCAVTDCQFLTKSLNELKEHKQMCHQAQEAKEQGDLMGEPVKSAETVSKTCGECGKIFKSIKILKKHMEYSHTEKEKIQCEHCDFATPYRSSMTTHLKIAHSTKKEMFMCKFCEYGTPLTGNLRKHLFVSHGLIVVTKHHKKSPEYDMFEEGTIITPDHKIFDPQTMEVPKTPKRQMHVYNKEICKTDGSEVQDKTEGKKQTRISLSKLPVEDFLKEMMKRHQEYVKMPEKNYSFMSSSIAAATEHPSFPQASPQVRNTRANKIYNMKKVKPSFTVQPEPISGSYGMGNIHGMYQGTATVPQVASEVEVEHDNQPEVVVENVEGDSPTTVLTISEQKGSDGAEMILINQNGKQTIVRSKDFYDTLQATGHDTNQTLGVISALLQAGEQIEIREQEELVEIQNI